MSVRIKLIIALTMILVGAFISLSLFNYNESREKIRGEIVNSSLPLTRDNIYSEIQAGLMRPLFVSSLMANDTFLKDWAVDGEKDLSRIIRYLSEIKDKYGFFSSFFVSARTGNYYHSDGILKKVSETDVHDIWFYDFVRSGEGHDLDVDTNEAAKNILTIFINHRVEDADGNLLGVTGVGLKMDEVSGLLKNFSEKYSKMIFLVDTQGVVQAHHEIFLIEKTNIRDLPGLGNIADSVLNTSAEPAMFKFSVDGETFYLTARYIPELEWFLIVEQNEEGSLKSARDNFKRTLVVGGLATLFIVMLSIVAVNHYQLRLEKQAETDELTGVANRRAFERRVDAAMALFTKAAHPFSIILLDIDGFKQVNDCCGHVDGDRMIRNTAALIQSAIRDEDCCARWGGDEFIILVPGESDDALLIADRIRIAAVQECRCGNGNALESGTIKITVSCGVAQFREGDTLDSLTLRADRAMYESKAKGKNRVEVG